MQCCSNKMWRKQKKNGNFFVWNALSDRTRCFQKQQTGAWNENSFIAPLFGKFFGVIMRSGNLFTEWLEWQNSIKLIVVNGRRWQNCKMNEWTKNYYIVCDAHKTVSMAKKKIQIEQITFEFIYGERQLLHQRNAWIKFCGFVRTHFMTIVRVDKSSFN